MLNPIIHRNKLTSILNRIFQSPVSHYFAFKGGTLCYFLYRLDRFSTDIDLDYIGPGESMQENIRVLCDAVSEIATIVKDVSNTYLRTISLSYGDNQMKVKLEIRKVLWKNTKYEIVTFAGLDIYAMERSCIVANKLVATFERKTNRDLWDVVFFLRNDWPISEALIFERTGMTLQDFFKALHEKLTTEPRQNLLDGMGEVLDDKQKYWVKNDMMRELLGILDMRARFG